MYPYILILHILGATIWTGGHLVLAITVLPRVLREKSVAELERFESGYERIGIPALLVQVITGFWLAFQRVPELGMWFDWSNPFSRLILLKLGLLVLTAIFAVDARLRIIPNLTEERLASLAFHIIPVTILSVLFVIVGVFFQTGVPF